VWSFLKEKHGRIKGIGLDLDWTRSGLTNFVNFELDPGCKSFINMGSVPEFD